MRWLAPAAPRLRAAPRSCTLQPRTRRRTELDLQEGGQRDELRYWQVQVLSAQFPLGRRSHIRQGSR
jgi:hypothetical protein